MIASLPPLLPFIPLRVFDRHLVRFADVDFLDVVVVADLVGVGEPNGL